MAGESGVIPTGTRTLAADVRGAGPDLVLLHPVGLDHTFMAPYLVQAARQHRVVALDLRGHGDSPLATRDVTLDDYVADIHLAMEVHCRGPAIVLGLSFGGMLAQLMALAHPERVSGLVLCGCTGGFAPEVPPILRERGLAAERDGMPSVVDATIERWFTPSFRRSDAAARVRTRLLTNDVTSWSTAWHAIATFDALPRLSTLQVPTLVVAGARDAATPITAATTLANAIPDARLTVLADAPHMMQIESRDAFNAALGPFLGRKANTGATL
jgi:3-oxoadipate enol-lactonase